MIDRKKFLYRFIIYVLFILYGVILIRQTWTEGCLYASEVDYISQHIQFADYFRKMFYAGGGHFGDFATAIGAGQNIYSISYYGLFRPDIMISLILPFVEMKDILVVYSILLYFFGTFLFYQWICQKRINENVKIIITMLYMCSSVLLQTHRQLMYVNYIPFLILVLIGIDRFYSKKRHGGKFIVAGTILMILHSYYFSVTSLILCAVYLVVKQIHLKNPGDSWKDCFFKKNFITPLLFMFNGVLITAFLLLPTFMAIVQSSRKSADIRLGELLIPRLMMDGLLENRNGCGLSFICMALLLLGITMKKTRLFCGAILFVSIMPIVSYVMSGFLYVNGKSYIPMIPFIIYECGIVIDELIKEEKFKRNMILVFMVLPFIGAAMEQSDIIELTKHDLIISIVLVMLCTKFKQVFVMVPIISAYLCILLNVSQDTLVTESDYEDMFESYSVMDQTEFDKDYRFQNCSINTNKNNNFVYDADLWQTTVYSSLIHNGYMDFAKNTIRTNTTTTVNNCVSPTTNIFFEILMGERYVYTKNITMAGYEKIASDKIGTLYENQDVLPVIYGTTTTVSEKKFEESGYPFNLGIIMNNTVVEDSENETVKGKNIVKEVDLADYLELEECAGGINISKDLKSVEIDSDKMLTAKFKVKNLTDVVIIKMDINNKDKDKKVVIRVNKVKDIMTSEGYGLYPNNNNEFNFVISDHEKIGEITIDFYEGKYSVTDIRAYVCNYDDINQYHKEVSYVERKEVSGNEVISGNVEMNDDGYLVTSIPYQDGLSIDIDGKEVEMEKVNTAFAGCKISKGKHIVTVSFVAPGRRAGQGISIFGIIMLFCIWMTLKREKKAC